MGKSTMMMKLPLDRFENVRQVGGIQTAVLDNGPERGCRVAYVNTGSPLRYSVSIDRGCDLYEAFYGPHSLCYLSPNGLKSPSHAYHQKMDWLVGWPAGMMTTCGPVYIGHDREENGKMTGLHGRHSNTPAEVEMLVNPDPARFRHEMLIAGIIRDTAAYGPSVEIRRTIQSMLGEASINVYDQTTNRDNMPSDHALMYHCNFGWPLLDKGAQLVMNGRIDPWPDDQQAMAPKTVEDFKKIGGPMKTHAGEASRGFICTPKADRHGLAHVGVINRKLGLAVELSFPLEQIPRVMCWQHYGPGMYVLGIEPMVGTPFGAAVEPDHAMQLAPGQTRRTELTLRVHDTDKAICQFARYDQPFIVD